MTATATAGAIFVGAGLEDLVTPVQLLCSAFAFTSPQRQLPVLVVYLYKRGTFYPFAPTGIYRHLPARHGARTVDPGPLGTDLPVETERGRLVPSLGQPAQLTNTASNRYPRATLSWATARLYRQAPTATPGRSHPRRVTIWVAVLESLCGFAAEDPGRVHDNGRTSSPGLQR